MLKIVIARIYGILDWSWSFTVYTIHGNPTLLDDFNTFKNFSFSFVFFGQRFGEFDAPFLLVLRRKHRLRKYGFQYLKEATHRKPNNKYLWGFLTKSQSYPWKMTFHGFRPAKNMESPETNCWISTQASTVAIHIIATGHVENLQVDTAHWLGTHQFMYEFIFVDTSITSKFLPSISVSRIHHHMLSWCSLALNETSNQIWGYFGSLQNMVQPLQSPTNSYCKNSLP